MGSFASASPLTAAERLATMGFGCLALALVGSCWMVPAISTAGAVYVFACVVLPTTLLVVRSMGLIRAGRALARAQAVQPAPLPFRHVWFVTALGGIGLEMAANFFQARTQQTAAGAALASLMALLLAVLARTFRFAAFYWAGAVIAVGDAVFFWHWRAQGVVLALGLDWLIGLSLWCAVLAMLVHARRFNYAGIG